MSDSGSFDVMGAELPLLQESRRNFTFSYLPRDITFVPNYTLQSIWWVGWMVVVEYCVLYWQGVKLPVVHDNVLSLVHGVLYEVTRVLVRGVEYGTYAWVWQHYSLLPTPSDSLLTMGVVMVLVDLGYYWLHRASHEIMVLWAIHQVHHSSQDLTVAVGLRHSPLQRLFSWVFYLPLALLGIPPAYMLAHVQFNLIYQFWIHTEVVSTLGPLEYVLNTPCHHRVHHGCNLKYLDKNYGGVFIVWDRLFGTFQPLLPGLEIVYGILVQPQSFNPLYHQVFYLKGSLEKAFRMNTFWDGVCALIKGPSWVPGSPWTGHEQDKISVTAPREYRPAQAQCTTHVYTIIHLCAALTLTNTLNSMVDSSSPLMVTVYSIVVVVALTCIGILYDQPSYTRALETCRCVLGLLICFLLPPPSSLLPYLVTLYSLSLIIFLVAPGIVLHSVPVKQE